MTTFFRSGVLALLLIALLAVAIPAVPHQFPSEPNRGQRTPDSPVAAEMERRRARDANKQRQVELKRDTDRLLQLATELKLYVDKSDENMLSLTVIKKAEEIEHLAKSVKDKMKGN